MINEFEKKYLNYIEEAKKGRYNRAHFIFHDTALEFSLLTEVIELYLSIIHKNQWNYEDFLDYQLRISADKLYGKISIDSRAYIYDILHPEFKEIYNNEIDIKFYFLQNLIDTKIPLDITSSICYLSDAIINTENIGMIYGCIMNLNKYNNPLCLPVIEKVLAYASDDWLDEDIVRYCNSIIARINNKYANLIIKANLNHPNEFVRKEILSTYNYLKSINT